MKAIPLEKGYYEFEFNCLKDIRKVLVWLLKSCRIFSWTKDFVPSILKITKTQMFGLVERIAYVVLEVFQNSKYLGSVTCALFQRFSEIANPEVCYHSKQKPLND